MLVLILRPVFRFFCAWISFISHYVFDSIYFVIFIQKKKIIISHHYDGNGHVLLSSCFSGKIVKLRLALLTMYLWSTWPKCKRHFNGVKRFYSVSENDGLSSNIIIGNLCLMIHHRLSYTSITWLFFHCCSFRNDQFDEK